MAWFDPKGWAIAAAFVAGGFAMLHLAAWVVVTLA